MSNLCHTCRTQAGSRGVILPFRWAIPGPLERKNSTPCQAPIHVSTTENPIHVFVARSQGLSLLLQYGMPRFGLDKNPLYVFVGFLDLVVEQGDGVFDIVSRCLVTEFDADIY